MELDERSSRVPEWRHLSRKTGEPMNRIKFVTTAILALIVLALANASAIQQGQATFSDKAPPPTEAQKNEAQRLNAVAMAAQSAMSAIGESLRATVLVDRSLASQKPATSGNQVLPGAIAKWRTS